MLSKYRIRPQVLAVMLVVGFLASLIVIFAPEHIEKTVPNAIVALGMLGMKVLEKE